ncbi:hypothetical protein [Staphylococcus equorum]|uniref:hypothetical protein n=1 Tax=Staphylococcus equorum TaxID=246432 RepID=UPI0018687239|nr:hypothetical protein [Staphylococcus equorum]
MGLQLKKHINKENVKMSKVDIRKYLLEILYSDILSGFENNNKKAKTIYSQETKEIPSMFLTDNDTMKIYRNKDRGCYKVSLKQDEEEFTDLERLGVAS